MASRTVVDSVPEVLGPPAEVEELDRQLNNLRGRFPGVIFARYLGRVPSVAPDVYIAPGASIVGDVRLASRSSVWFGCVLRGDLSPIEVGEGSNIQDGTVIHVGDRDGTKIGRDVVVGHRAMLHACTIGDACLIGMQSTVLDASEIGAGSVLAAGCVVTAQSKIDARSLLVGIPARVVKTVTAADEDFHRQLAAKYRRLAQNYQVG